MKRTKERAEGGAHVRTDRDQREAGKMTVKGWISGEESLFWISK